MIGLLCCAVLFVADVETVTFVKIVKKELRQDFTNNGEDLIIIHFEVDKEIANGNGTLTLPDGTVLYFDEYAPPKGKRPTKTKIIKVFFEVKDRLKIKVPIKVELKYRDKAP